MKSKELKTGVIYARKVKPRINLWRPQLPEKAVIVSLDRTYARPSENMFHSQKTIVTEATGPASAYLVIEADLRYSDERLLEIAESFQLPVTGEAWPYHLTKRSLKKEVEKQFYIGNHEYGNPTFNPDSNGRDHYPVPRLALWSPQHFDHVFQSQEDEERRARDNRDAHLTKRAKQKESTEQRTKLMLDGISELSLDGVSDADVYDKPGKRRVKAEVSLDVLEALLRKAREAANV